MDFSTLGSIIFSIGATVAGFFGYHPLAAALPAATAVFETSLAAPISSSATSMTLAANSVRGGGALSGFNCFTVDEGSAQAETICGTVSGTAVSSLTRGVSQSTGTSTVAALQFAHRRGANVKISDFPVIQILKALANGEDTFPNILKYTSQAAGSFTSSNDIVNKAYVDALAFGGAPAASETANGFVELATQAEAASSTSSGSAARLVLPASIATSTYNAATAPLRVLVSGNDGKLDRNFLDSTIVSTSSPANFATSSLMIGAFPAYHIGKNVQVFTNTGTSTFTVPSGITKVFVEVQGGGGAGNTGVDSGSTGFGGGGGGAGGYANEVVDVTGTTTIQVYVAPASAADVAGTWSTFGTNGFYLSASGGSAGSGQSGGAGGIGSGGDFNREGADGAAGGFATASDAADGAGGAGGSSQLGGGGAGGASGVGQPGNLYGGGGGGGRGNGGAANAGGVGAQGIVIVRW